MSQPPARDQDSVQPELPTPAERPTFRLLPLVWIGVAILAGVIAQILVLPPGALASVPDWLRYGAVAAGFAVFMLRRRSIFAGVVSGELVMLGGKWWLG